MSYPHAQSGKFPLPPFAKEGQGAFGTEGGTVPAVACPHFHDAASPVRRTGERPCLAVRCGNPPILLLPPLKSDGPERDPRLSYSTEIALDPISLTKSGRFPMGVPGPEIW